MLDSPVARMIPSGWEAIASGTREDMTMDQSGAGDVRFAKLCQQALTQLCHAFSDHGLYPHPHPTL